MIYVSVVMHIYIYIYTHRYIMYVSVVMYNVCIGSGWRIQTAFDNNTRTMQALKYY